MTISSSKSAVNLNLCRLNILHDGRLDFTTAARTKYEPMPLPALNHVRRELATTIVNVMTLLYDQREVDTALTKEIRSYRKLITTSDDLDCYSLWTTGVQLNIAALDQPQLLDIEQLRIFRRFNALHGVFILSTREGVEMQQLARNLLPKATTEYVHSGWTAIAFAEAGIATPWLLQAFDKTPDDTLAAQNGPLFEEPHHVLPSNLFHLVV